MKKENKVKISNLLLIFTLFLFLILGYRISFIGLSEKVDNINIQELASKRTTQTTILKASRGTIYDNSKNILARDVSSYTLIAYLDPKRTEDEKNPRHVVDKENTALVLSKLLDMDKDLILKYLNKEGIYQTEFGIKGKGLTELEKDTIKAANLPGIDFIETKKRYYPYGKFLSYLIGYAKEDENGDVKGEMGIEKYYNKELTGVNGKTVYQKDLKGYKIASTKEITEEKQDGVNIHLTIDNNIQFFLEEAVNKSREKYDYDELDIIVADAKTGEILGYTSTPSFDPNIRDITNYLDPNSEIAFEPGSTMKIYTYMAALENGVYKGSDKYYSGSFETKDKTVIRDWNRVGWGKITYDQGFIYSSNTAVVNIMDKYLDANSLKTYLKRLGFGSKTGISLPNEASGKINFKYETEVFNAAFGQGILITPIQMVKALTSISNDGELLSPYIVKKIEYDDGTVKEYNRNSLGNVACSQTIEYMKNLMWHTVNDADGAAHYYAIDGFNIIGKTGTAQIAKTGGLGYLSGNKDVIRSIALMFPKDNPEIIIYGAVKRSETVSALSEPIKEIIQNIAKYKNIYKEKKDSQISEDYILNNYINYPVSDIEKKLNELHLNVIKIGNGDTIINQYPINTKISNEEKIFLFTNSNITIPNLIGYSKSDLEVLLNYLNIDYSIKGNGYVVSQNIEPGSEVKEDTKLELVLETKLKKS